MKTIKEEIASNLLFYRKRANYTQKGLAEKLGIKHNSISAWETGVNSIDVEILFKICAILDVSVNDMFGSYSRVNELILAPAESKIIENYRTLNTEGQEKSADYIDDLVQTGKYKKNNFTEMGTKQA